MIQKAYLTHIKFMEFLAVYILILKSPVTTTRHRNPSYGTSLHLRIIKFTCYCFSSNNAEYRFIFKKDASGVSSDIKDNAFTPDVVKWRIGRHNAINNHSKHCHFQLKDPPQRVQTRRMSSDASWHNDFSHFSKVMWLIFLHILW